MRHLDGSGKGTKGLTSRTGQPGNPKTPNRLRPTTADPLRYYGFAHGSRRDAGPAKGRRAGTIPSAACRRTERLGQAGRTDNSRGDRPA